MTEKNQKLAQSITNGPTGEEEDVLDELEQNVNALFESVKANSAKQQADKASRDEVSDYVISSAPKSTTSGLAISLPPPATIPRRNSMLSTAAN